ncbi:aggregation factor core [Planktotalea sp.]|uniref:aggregation factor core n=1 Tax=Planktotalea sp. TaxID=2029877 RepID=UPI003299D4E9
MNTCITLTAAALIAGSALHADIDVRFIEGAPKDRFVITSHSDCLNGPIDVAINLDGSAGGLIFDITSAGAGVEVFQPFELVSGGDWVTKTPVVTDGDTALSLSLSSLPKGQSVSFTLDVDDTGGAREITVSGGEIAGAGIMLAQGGKTYKATFGDNARAKIAQSGCES